MNDVELLPHNEVAYEKLVKSLEENQMTSINHATGTGKSFIMLKYLFHNRDKRILYLAPTYQILEQFKEEHTEELGLKESDFKKLDTMIYRTLLGKNLEELAKSYDIIVLDEYHRCGARKWGKRVKKLLDIIKSDYKDTKVIGTTATEIRYLDHEKNMNNILFNGVEASRLSLADAILQGILPAPVYVSFNYSMVEEIRNIENRIKQFSFYPGDTKEALKEIIAFQNKLEKTFDELSNVDDYINDNGKYLVFSSQIKKIDDDHKIILKMLKKVDNVYSVHSNKKKEENKRILKEFRNKSHDQTSVLYSVNLLNEGVHVKDVDGLFMLRPTISPIIYFQQLGRLLSYSRRKDQVVVFDMVNNVRNYPVIYELYSDVVKKATEYIKTDPENADRYTKIVERFKIVDLTSSLSEEIDRFKEKYSKDSLIEKRLNTAIKILKNPENYTEVELFQAKIDIFKYERYIDLNMFKELKKIDKIEKPNLLSLTEEGFKEIIGDKKNIKERINNGNVELTSKVRNFIYEYEKLPTIFSEDEGEKNLALEIINKFYSIGTRLDDLLYKYSDDNISLFERVIYGDKIVDDIEIVELYKQTLKALEVPCIIPTKILKIIKKIINEEEYNKIEEKNENVMDFYRDYSNEIIKKVVGVNKENKIISSIIFRNEFLKIEQKCLKELKEKKEDEFIFDLFKDIYDFILKNRRNINFFDPNYKSKETENELLKEQELYCKKIIFHDKLKEKGYLDTLDELLIKTEQELKENYTSLQLEKLYTYINENNGMYPSRKSDKKEEVELARFFYNNKNSLTEEQLKKLQNLNDKYEKEKKEFIKKYIIFIKKNRREPISNSSEYEKQLLEDYERWYPLFTSSELEQMRNTLKSIPKKEQILNAYESFLKQKK